ncbi:MAG: flagellar hook-basal body complex protein FliE [Robiginitomaculum sp.]|nr:flagellar hook-basal body complex protein FliE [Robiginitomaculum sp.]
MEPSALGALRHYQAAQKSIAPDKAKLSGTEEKGKIAQGVEEFSKVFENVEKATQAMSVGQADAHSVVEAMATAEMALETAVTVRNRVVEAYQELLRMPV